MVTLGKRETPANPDNQIDNSRIQSTESPKISGYEQTREKRIKENLERMQKLGILDLSLKFKTISLPPKPTRKKAFNGRTPQSPSDRPLRPTRRSSRLKNATPIDYSDKHVAKFNGARENEDFFREEGSKPEVYTEENEKQLGSTDKIWTLFVDGYGKDGRRIYDSVNGKTCHQCRQKTLGHHTHCSKCNKIRGQFCGDCLYMRYGEHVLEAKDNPNWICPVCRGICNCSLCRQAKGWAPTGQLYRKISQLGFKSVAHYLIQVEGSNSSLRKDSRTQNRVPARRSLPFSDADELSEKRDFFKSSVDQYGLRGPECEEKMDDKFRSEKEKEMDLSDKYYGNGLESIPKLQLRPLSIPDIDAPKVSPSTDAHQALLEPECEDKSIDCLKGDEKEMHSSDSINTTEIHPKLGKVAACATNSSTDSIAGRLKQRRLVNGNDNDGKELMKNEEETLEIKLALDNSSENEANLGSKVSFATTPSSALKVKEKPAPVNEPDPDSIAGRLRQRRRTLA